MKRFSGSLKVSQNLRKIPVCFLLALIQMQAIMLVLFFPNFDGFFRDFRNNLSSQAGRSTEIICFSRVFESNTLETAYGPSFMEILEN